MIKLYKKVSVFIRDLKKVRTENIKENSKLNIEKKATKHDEIIKATKQDLELLALERELKEKKNMIKCGKKMASLGYIGTLVSLILSVVGGYSNYRGVFEVIAFVLVMSVIQAIVFIISLYESKLCGFYKLKTIQLIALCLSIYNSFNFFEDKNICNLVLCAILDFGTISLLKASTDFKNLLYKDNRVSIVSMFLNNLTFKMKTKIQRYIENNKVKTNLLSEDIEVKTSEDKVKTSEDIEDKVKVIEDIENYIEDNYNVGDKIKVKQLKEKFKIKDRAWKDMVNSINNAKIINTRLTKIHNKISLVR